VPENGAAVTPRSDGLTLRSVLKHLPPTATALYTLVTVGPAARQMQFLRISKSAQDLDRARLVFLDRTTEISGPHRSPAIRVVQATGLIGSQMVAIARIAAQGSPRPLEVECHDRARDIAGLADSVVLSLPRQRSTKNRREHGMPPNTAKLMGRLNTISQELDLLMAQLTMRRVPPAIPPDATVDYSSIRAQRST